MGEYSKAEAATREREINISCTETAPSTISSLSTIFNRIHDYKNLLFFVSSHEGGEKGCLFEKLLDRSTENLGLDSYVDKSFR